MKPQSLIGWHPRCLAIAATVSGFCFICGDIAAAQEVSAPIVQTPMGPAREAPIGHRQPRLEDLPPQVQRDEQLNPPSARVPPQSRTRSRSHAGAAGYYLWPRDQDLSICRGC
jgi:hypothetical protein